MPTRSPLIFISHAGTDSGKASQIGDMLQRAGVSIILDKFDLGEGGDFVAFMEDSLGKSDYCLLLWSKAAASRPFVQMEYRAAFAKEALQRRAFLLVGRLEDFAPPVLYASRVYIDLFPSLDGVTRFVDMWTRDQEVVDATRKPVVPLPADRKESPEDDTALNPSPELYVTSELFDCTLPFPAVLDRPAGVLLDAVRVRLELPSDLNVRSRLGLRLGYALLFKDIKLDRIRCLRAQGVAPGDVLTLEVTTEVVSAVAATTLSPGRQVFRPVDEAHDALIRMLEERHLRGPEM